MHTDRDGGILFVFAEATAEAKEEPLSSKKNGHEQQACRVVADYDTPFPNPLVVRTGEQLTTGDRESEWPGWILVHDPERRQWLGAGELCHATGSGMYHAQ